MSLATRSSASRVCSTVAVSVTSCVVAPQWHHSPWPSLHSATSCLTSGMIGEPALSVPALSFAMSIFFASQWRAISSAASFGMMPSRPCAFASAASKSRYFWMRFSSDHTARIVSVV